MAGAKNIYGEESEQSKERRGRKAEELAGEGSFLERQAKLRKYKESRLDEITGGGLSPTRQGTPPQYGRSNMEADEEGNQDTLK
ncbi:MAG: hypothetical protein E3J58_05595 [Actinomycetota bacterium]|nr:MAG: hypothetical protein E3J58_05595 [Actinomycetota bacterium]